MKYGLRDDQATYYYGLLNGSIVKVPAVDGNPYEKMDCISGFLRKLSESKGISAFFRSLLYQDYLHVHFPEIQAMVGCEENPKWHPEGDTFEHTMLVLDEYESNRTLGDRLNYPLFLSCLYHDMGKPWVKPTPGKVGFFPGHAQIGAKMWKDVADNRGDYFSMVHDTIYYHMHMHQMGDMKPRTIFKMLHRIDSHTVEPDGLVDTVYVLAALGETDRRGRLGASDIPSADLYHHMMTYVNIMQASKKSMKVLGLEYLKDEDKILSYYMDAYQS